MEDKNENLYKVLVDLEKKLLEGNFDVNLELQSHKSDIDRLRDVVDELKRQELHLTTSHNKGIKDVGQSVSLNTDKLYELGFKLNALEERLAVLEEFKNKTDKRVWSYVDKVVIAIISGIMTLLFNNLI